MFDKAGKYYISKGISVVATDEFKRTLQSWKKYQAEIVAPGELVRQYENPKAKGIAIICGAVSGGLEVIDIDSKYDITGKLIISIFAMITDQAPALIDQLYTVSTQSGGMHIYYRCEVVEGNKKLASRPATDQEKAANPLDKVKVLIETRGEGGYVVAPPTTGYKRLQKDREIPVITIEQRDTLLSIMRSFNEVMEPVREQKVQGSEKFGVKPWEDYSERGDHHALLQAQGWQYISTRGDNEYYRRPGKDEGVSASWSISKRLFYCFTSSSPFEPAKAYRLSSVYAILEHNGDFSAAAKALADQGYGEQVQNYGRIERSVFKKKQEGYNREDLKAYVKKNYNKEESEADELLTELENKWGEEICAFWTPDKNGNPVIHHSKLVQFLTENGGFYLYFYDKSSTIFRIIRLHDGLVEEASTEQMKKFIINYIDGLPDHFDGGMTPAQLLEAVHKASAGFFTEGKMEWMQHVNPSFLRDKKAEAFFPFSNGIVHITRNGVGLRTYKDIDGAIWRNQVIDFPIEILPEETIDCEFARFLQCICNKNEERLSSVCTFIGYLLHRYKDPARPWSVILAEETENEDQGGGTGKGIFVKAISTLIKTVKVDGKNFSMDKNFALQRVALDTQLIAVEDCDRKMDFEKFNSQLTEGSTVEKKNKDELFIEYKDSPKWIFTTNYVMNIKGNHGKRRSKTFEFSPYFSPSHTPIDEFGHLLFEDWDQDEWNRFYNFLFGCLSIYLEAGLIEITNSPSIKRKQIRLQFGDEFLEWFQDWAGLEVEKSSTEIEYSTPKSSTWMPFKDLYDGFLKHFDLEKKEYSNKRFKKGMEIASDLYGFDLVGRRNRQNNNAWEWKITASSTGKSHNSIEF